jgi:hypothetical protein
MSWMASSRNKFNDEVVTISLFIRCCNVTSVHLDPKMCNSLDYAAVIKLPSGEFQRVVRDLSQFGESVVISVTKVCLF